MSWSVDGPESVPGLRAACKLVAKAALERRNVGDLASALFLYASKVAELARVGTVYESVKVADSVSHRWPLCAGCGKPVVGYEGGGDPTTGNPCCSLACAKVIELRESAVMKKRARLDADGTAKPKTRTVHHPRFGDCVGQGPLVRPEYETEAGERIALMDQIEDLVKR